MSDEELRKLEREALGGDADAELRLLAERRRRGLDPVAEITLHAPFPIQLPYPTRDGEERRPYQVHTQEEGVTLFFPALAESEPWEPSVQARVSLIHYPRLRSVEDAFEHYYKVVRILEPEPMTLDRYRAAGGVQVFEAGSGTVACFDYSPLGSTREASVVHYVISRRGAAGAVEVCPDDRAAFRFDPSRISVGPTGAWADDPEIREPGRLPWGDGEPGVTEFPDPDA
jgi:hypothetical protein